MTPSHGAPDSNPATEQRRAPKLLDRVREAVRVRHYSRRTEEAYVTWIRRFIVFHGKKHPSDMGAEEIRRFLTSLAVERRVSASTQNQALSSLLFLYRHVLGRDPGSVDHVPRASSPMHVPVVLSVDEVRAVLDQLTGVSWIVIALLYGSGLRLQECLELRVKDLDFDRNQIVIRRGKGQKDRRTMLPASVKARLTAHLEDVRRQHQRDLSNGFGRVTLPVALERKYPNAAADWRWQFAFPATRICRDSRFGPPSRYHLHESAVQRAVVAAVRRAGLTKRVSCHTFRHHADSRIMPTALGHERDRGGDRALPETSVGMIRGARETRGVDRVGGTGLVSHRSAWCGPAPAL